MSKKIIILLIIVLGLLGFNLFKAEGVKAGSADNVWSWAWGGYPTSTETGNGSTETGSGWISFNCYNDYNGDGTPESHCTDAGYTSNYGVHINGEGKFSGYAWSGGGEEGGNPARVLGWLSFNRTDTGAPPNDDPCPDGSCTAKIDNVDSSICDVDNNGQLDVRCGGNNSTTPIGNFKQIFGWARFLSACDANNDGVFGDCQSGPCSNCGGWDGWVKLSHYSSTSSNRNYGVVIDTTTNPKEFRGWAWGGDVVGWISFNTSNYTGGSDYKVMTNFTFTPPNQPPTAENLDENVGNYCFSPNPPIFLSWEFQDNNLGDEQAAYYIQVDDNSNFTSPEIDVCVYDSSKISNPGACQPGVGSSNEYHPTLSYETTYYWRVKVWDNQGEDSVWAYGTSFTTDSRHPWPNFNWKPSRPKVGENVQFCSVEETGICEEEPTGGWSECYNSPCSYSWTFTNGNPVSSTAQNPTSTFSQIQDYPVTLGITDSNGNYCELTKTLRPAYPLPFWREIPPF